MATRFRARFWVEDAKWPVTRRLPWTATKRPGRRADPAQHRSTWSAAACLTAGRDRDDRKPRLVASRTWRPGFGPAHECRRTRAVFSPAVLPLRARCGPHEHGVDRSRQALSEADQPGGGSRNPWVTRGLPAGGPRRSGQPGCPKLFGAVARSWQGNRCPLPGGPCQAARRGRRRRPGSASCSVRDGRPAGRAERHRAGSVPPASSPVGAVSVRGAAVGCRPVGRGGRRPQVTRSRLRAPMGYHGWPATLGLPG